MSTEFDQRVAQAKQRLLDAYESEPPGALFDQIVRHGFVDREGRVTKLLGGEADMEPEAQPPVLPDEG